MALSDNEQRILDELEKQFAAQDPKLTKSFQNGPAGKFSSGKILIGVLALVVGLVLLIFAVSSKMILLGVLGFVVMLLGVLYATAQPKSMDNGSEKALKDHPVFMKPAKKNSKFMKKMEDRWDERQK